MDIVRKKKNRSGTVSVVVTDKSRSQFKVLTTIGVSYDSGQQSRSSSTDTSRRRSCIVRFFGFTGISRIRLPTDTASASIPRPSYIRISRTSG